MVDEIINTTNTTSKYIAFSLIFLAIGLIIGIGYRSYESQTNKESFCSSYNGHIIQNDYCEISKEGVTDNRKVECYKIERMLECRFSLNERLNI